MTKKEILDDLIRRMEDYVENHNDKAKWEAYVYAWRRWREVKGDE